MLLRAVPERALGALFGGAPAADALQLHLAALSVDAEKAAASADGVNPALPKLPTERLPVLRMALRAAIQADIDQRTGRRHRFNESQQAADNLCNDQFLQSPDIVSLDDAVAALFVTQNDEVHFADVHVHRYAEVLAEVDPTLLVAWQLIRRNKPNDPDGRANLSVRVRGLTNLFVGPRFMSLPFADNHVHLGGVVGDELVLAQLIVGSSWPDSDRIAAHLITRLRRIRRVLLALVGIWSSHTAVNASVTEAQQIELLRTCRDDAETIPTNPTLDWPFAQEGLGGSVQPSSTPKALPVASGGPDAKPINSQWLLQQLVESARAHDLQRAWIWLLALLWWTYRLPGKTQGITRSVIILFLADTMVLRRQMLMDGSGLRRFTSGFFHSPLRKSAAAEPSWLVDSMTQTVQRLFTAPQDKAEIKIFAATLLDADVATAFARAAQRRISSLHTSSAPTPAPSLSAASAPPTVASPLDQWHFCAHFNRVKKSSRADLWKQAEKLAVVLRSLTPWSLAPPLGLGLSVAGEHQALPAQLIRGLDVVGDETQWLIERFAPMLRWLRSLESERDPANETIALTAGNIQLHLSIHAGEDYAHPLSGLRHVDETVRFCAMRAGDRLGHALALGIPPDEWLHGHGEALLSVDDHVDNLVWAWNEARELPHLQEAQKVMQRLQARALRFLPHVSWWPQEPGSALLNAQTMVLLHEAWLLRRNCAHRTLSAKDQSIISDLRLRIAAPDISRLRPQLKSPPIDTAEGLYVLRARRENPSPTDVPKPLRHVRVTVQRHGHPTRAQRQLEASDASDLQYLHDHDDGHDLRFMLALQDRCIERYALLGLSIETNPSSNVYIGQLQTHSDHPIFRWNPPDRQDLGNGRRFNQFSLRSRPISVTINTDDPGVIPTTLRMEHHLMHEAAIDRGHTVAMADTWITQLRQEGLQCFADRH